MRKIVREFIQRTPVALNLLIFGLSLDILLFVYQLHNYHEFSEKPQYQIILNPKTYDYTVSEVTTSQNQNTQDCPIITKSDLKNLFNFKPNQNNTYPDPIYNSTSAASIQTSSIYWELKERVDFLNKIDCNDILIITILSSIYNIGTSFIPYSLDLLMTILQIWVPRLLKDTQKISFIRNLITINWVQMETIVLAAIMINNVSYEDCLQPRDCSLLLKDNLKTFWIILLVCAVVQIYVVLFFLVKQRNRFSCAFFSFLIVNFIIFHTVILYYTAISSKKEFTILFTFRQWVTGFVIFKLQCEFPTVQQKQQQLRLIKFKLEKNEYI